MSRDFTIQKINRTGFRICVEQLDNMDFFSFTSVYDLNTLNTKRSSANNSVFENRIFTVAFFTFKTTRRYACPTRLNVRPSAASVSRPKRPVLASPYTIDPRWCWKHFPSIFYTRVSEIKYATPLENNHDVENPL